ncbi:MAG: hypothetical protein GX640_03855 [Fibrobacter sp.]|nr:hypothetical protein [Fibrobacter sp.]
MSENVSRSITLVELIKRTDLIVIGTKVDSSLFTEDRYIISSPPFTSRYYLFSLSEVIFTRSESLPVPQKLHIYCADDTLHYQLYKKYVIDGLKISVETDFYSSDIPLEQTAVLILFLKKEQRAGKFSFTVNGAYESISRIQEIKDILQSISRKQEQSDQSARPFIILTLRINLFCQYALLLKY